MRARRSAADRPVQRPSAPETLTVTADTAFYEQALPDGEYLMIFEMRDSQGNSAYSQGVGFTVDGEDITTSVYE